MEKLKNTSVKIPQRIQSTFQYISIKKTFHYLFNREDFLNMYLNYNATKHICKPKVYKGFCCGKVFKKNALFQKYPNSLQINIASDDFECCNPLQSKAMKHKLCNLFLYKKHSSRSTFQTK